MSLSLMCYQWTIPLSFFRITVAPFMLHHIGPDTSRDLTRFPANIQVRYLLDLGFDVIPSSGSRKFQENTGKESHVVSITLTLHVPRNNPSLCRGYFWTMHVTKSHFIIILTNALNGGCIHFLNN